MNAEFPADEPDLVALIGSRICHDLVSPVGAIGNGLELIGMAAGAQASTQGGAKGGASGAPAAFGPELDLVRESAATAQAKLRFFRIAFGQSSPGQDVGRPEILGILTELYEGGRLRVHWAVDGAVPRPEAKLAFLLLQCVESAMPYGGQVHIGRTRHGWRVHGEAEKLRFEPLLWEALAGGVVPVPLRPSQVQFGLVRSAVARLGSDLTVERGQGFVTLSA